MYSWRLKCVSFSNGVQRDTGSPGEGSYLNHNVTSNSCCFYLLALLVHKHHRVCAWPMERGKSSDSHWRMESHTVHIELLLAVIAMSREAGKCGKEGMWPLVSLPFLTATSNSWLHRRVIKRTEVKGLLNSQHLARPTAWSVCFNNVPYSLLRQ